MDVEELKQATLYRNCDMATQKCQWFFEVLSGWQRGEPMCDSEEVRESLTEPFGTQNKKVLKVIEYATGTDRCAHTHSQPGN